MGDCGFGCLNQSTIRVFISIHTPHTRLLNHTHPNPNPNPNPPPKKKNKQVGDELRLKLGPLAASLHGKPWEGVGQILRLTEGEVALEMRASGGVPLDVTEGCVRALVCVCGGGARF